MGKHHNELVSLSLELHRLSLSLFSRIQQGCSVVALGAQANRIIYRINSLMLWILK